MRSRFTRLWAVALGVVAGALTSSLRADVDSGPAVGNDVPALKVYAVTGDITDKEVDYAAERAEKPTVYVFIPKAKWDRPTARFLKDLDTKLRETAPEGLVVAVWLTDDQFVTKDYLPKAKQSLDLKHTALTYYQGDVAGPPDWGLNSEADATVVVAGKKKIGATWGFVSVNETLLRKVLAAVKEAAN